MFIIVTLLCFTISFEQQNLDTNSMVKIPNILTNFCKYTHILRYILEKTRIRIDPN